ncbi:metallophosphoesterase 1 homolog [Strongylocentrotus purpuratus]|uniref:Calcineurin-like phosphoesterase domain-containing protein n=1 Tax=Strongylocentrotus purpuratus TaxID=7668 RepID=A0A7M7HKP1_STRPU|nr:metallophosphoesterase 1 homolog [Strongylocentrotus purpuratus]|eukprot:XP_011676909.1 PREDICTED: metallophosphoesterase 1 homolog [Strongylocentrotus purpuratus]
MVFTSPFNTILVVSGLFLVIYNEYYEFLTVKHNQWTASEATLPPLTKSDGRDTVRILFVGDPQIQGYQDEPALLGYLTRWDADRYLKTYYHHALNFVNPDIVIIMGDLLDEGSISEDWEFERYATRLKNIYEVPEGVQIIYLAGDNDIGGEGNDPITPQKIARFEKHFSSVTEAVQYKHVAFHKINVLPYIHRPPNEREDRTFRNQLQEMGKETQSASIHIVLSHTGISEAMLHRHIQIMRVLKPKYAFSAHSHYSSYMKHNLLQLVDFFKKVYPRDSSLDRIKEDIFMEEYRIPTCSYRMGVPNMAYAAAVIDADGTLHYTLLWLPSRYRQLYRYAAFIIVIAMIVFYRFMCRPRGRRRHDYHSYNSYMGS